MSCMRYVVLAAGCAAQQRGAGAAPEDTGSPCVPVTWFTDGDGDGYGAPPTVEDCEQPAGSTALDGDCDDTNAWISPAEGEIVEDGVDQNCNGMFDDEHCPFAGTLDLDCTAATGRRLDSGYGVYLEGDGCQTIVLASSCADPLPIVFTIVEGSDVFAASPLDLQLSAGASAEVDVVSFFQPPLSGADQTAYGVLRIDTPTFAEPVDIQLTVKIPGAP